MPKFCREVYAKSDAWKRALPGFVPALERLPGVGVTVGAAHDSAYWMDEPYLQVWQLPPLSIAWNISTYQHADRVSLCALLTVTPQTSLSLRATAGIIGDLLHVSSLDGFDCTPCCRTTTIMRRTCWTAARASARRACACTPAQLSSWSSKAFLGTHPTSLAQSAASLPSSATCQP